MPFDCKTKQRVWAGIDVSQQAVDFCVLNGQQNPRGRRPRRAAELAQLAASLVALGVSDVVVEATGGLEQAVWAALEAGGLRVAVLPPQRVRSFARARGVEAKTDRLDAETLARFGAALEPAATPLPSAAQRRYQELLRLLEFLMDQRAKLRLKQRRASDELAQAAYNRLEGDFSTEIARLESAVGQALEALPQQAAQAKLLRTAPGVGPKTAWALTAELPELGALSGKQAAALAGLAPRARDSGAFSGRRSIGGGRPRLRRALYLAAWTAIRCDLKLGSFYQRLVAAGKAKQLAVIAVARRLLVILNAMARDQTTWRPLPDA